PRTSVLRVNAQATAPAEASYSTEPSRLAAWSDEKFQIRVVRELGAGRGGVCGRFRCASAHKPRKPMTTERETLQRVRDGLYYLRRGLTPFVEGRMKARHCPNWPPAGVTLDEYGLLKTMLGNWREVFD